MADLRDRELNKKLRELKKQDIPSAEDIKKKSERLEEKEDSFLKKFFKRISSKKRK